MKVEVYALGPTGTNCYLVWDEVGKDAMIIDPGLYPAAIERRIADERLDIKYIALTHGHGDHMGGVPEAKAVFPIAVLCAGAAEAELLGDPRMNASAMITGKEIALEADAWLKGGDVLTLGSLSFQVIETPGHTPGGITLYIPEYDSGLADGEFSGTAFTGDTLFHASVGRTDLAGGDFQTMKASIVNELFALPDDTLVLPGHMDATSIGFEKRYNPFVK